MTNPQSTFRTPYSHPLGRLLLCALGFLGVAVLMALMLRAGSLIATLWTNRPASTQLAVIASRYTLPLTLLSYPACLLWISYCRTQLDRRSFISLGLRARRAFPDFLRGGLAGTFAIAFLWAVLWLTGAISVVGWAPNAFDARPEKVLLMLAGYGLAFLAVGFFEEVLFRGYALHNLNAWLGWRGALAAQAVFFAAIHLFNVAGAPRSERLAALYAMPAISLIAVFFALCYRKTGSLWFPIGFHAAWNWCLGCVFSLPVSGIPTFRLLDVQTNAASWLTGGKFGAEGSLLLLPILGALIYVVAREPDHPQANLDLGLLTAPSMAPAPVALITEAENEETVEEPRESRFRTGFRSAPTFDADTLRDLREMQEKRRREAEEHARDIEKAAGEAEAVAALAPVEKEDVPSPISEETVPALTPVIVPVAVPESISAPNATLTKPPDVSATPATAAPTAAPNPAEAPPAAPSPPAPRKPAPRW